MALVMADSIKTGRLAWVISHGLRLFAVLWLVWVLAGLFWMLTGQSSARLLVPARQAVVVAPVVDTTQLARLDVFGAPPAATATDVAANAPDTSLQLRLTGVFVNNDPEQSSAIVVERNNPSAPAKVYRVNESLPGGATLAEVYDDRILLKRGGNSEVLRFEKKGLLMDNAAQADNTDNNDWRSMLSNAMQSLAAAPEQFVKQMGLKPGANGYEVTAATPENLRTAAGLQPGDFLASLNGKPLGDPRRDRDVLADVQTAGNLSVEIKRGGQSIVLNGKL